MSYRAIRAAVVAAASWCALPTSAAAWQQQVGAYYRNPYTGSFSYGTYQYNPYTGQSTYGDPYNPYTNQYGGVATYYNNYTNTYTSVPVYNRYTGRYFSHYGYLRH